MRQPRFRKRLEKEHIAEQILTKQIISLPSPWMATSVPLLEERERERGMDFFLFFFLSFCMHTDLTYVPRHSRSFEVWPLLAN